MLRADPYRFEDRKFGVEPAFDTTGCFINSAIVKTLLKSLPNSLFSHFKNLICIRTFGHLHVYLSLAKMRYRSAVNSTHLCIFLCKMAYYTFSR